MRHTHPSQSSVERGLVVPTEQNIARLIIVIRWLVSPCRRLKQASLDSTSDEIGRTGGRAYSLAPDSKNTVGLELRFKAFPTFRGVLDHREKLVFKAELVRRVSLFYAIEANVFISLLDIRRQIK